MLGKCIHYRNKWQFLKTVYFISDTNRKDKRKRIYPLYRKPLPYKRQELVSNIDQLKIEYVCYFLLKYNSIIHYLIVVQVKNWKEIKSVKLVLLFFSP